MKYCENCQILVEDGDFCPQCSSLKLREAKENDFCFLFEINQSSRESYQSYFDQADIPCAFIPSGDGVRSKLGLRLENYKVYVPYESYDFCLAAFKKDDDEEEDFRIKSVRENLSSLNIALNPKKEKKIRKKLRLSENDDILDAVESLILTCERVSDLYCVVDGVRRECYLFYKKGSLITVRSDTFEILYVE